MVFINKQLEFDFVLNFINLEDTQSFVDVHLGFTSAKLKIQYSFLLNVLPNNKIKDATNIKC
jgi:predicted transport protein